MTAATSHPAFSQVHLSTETEREVGREGGNGHTASVSASRSGLGFTVANTRGRQKRVERPLLSYQGSYRLNFDCSFANEQHVIKRFDPSAISLVM